VHAEIALRIFYPNKTERTEKIWNRASTYIIYNWEAMVIYSRLSIILALSALYNAAFTLLRNSLELLVKGAFYQCLTDAKLRSRWSLDKGDPASKLRRYLVNKVRTTPELQRLEENTSAEIFNLLRKPLYRTRLRFSPIMKQVIDWGILYPMSCEEASNMVNNIYNELCANVHEHPDKIDFGRIIREKGEVFEQKPLEKSLVEFLKTWVQILDIATVISINISRLEREPHGIKTVLSEIAKWKKFQQVNMPLTKKLFHQLLAPE
jgi:hypothetical protein